MKNLEFSDLKERKSTNYKKAPADSIHKKIKKN